MKFDELDFFVVEILNISFKTNCTHAFLFWKSLDMVTSFEVFLCDNIVNTFVVVFLLDNFKCPYEHVNICVHFSYLKTCLFKLDSPWVSQTEVENAAQ